MLTTNTIISAAPGLPNLPDDPAAAQARQTGPIIDTGLDLEAAGAAIAMHVVADTAAAGRNGIRQRFADGRHQHLITRPADPVGRPQRRNTRAEDAF